MTSIAQILTDDSCTVATACASPKDSMDSLHSKVFVDETKSARFASNEELIRQYEPSRIELSEDNIAALWYTKDEYRLIKKSQFFTIKMMERTDCSSDDEELCPRGLESKTRSGKTRRHINIETGWDAVLHEQERQWEDGRHSSASLAQAYRQATAQCTMAAFLSGKRDAQFVHGCYWVR